MGTGVTAGEGVGLGDVGLGVEPAAGGVGVGVAPRLVVTVRALRRHETLHAGEYKFDRPASPWEVYDRLARGDVHYYLLRVPEGAASLEGAVAVMLVLLGLLTVRDHLRKRVHVHVHEHGGTAHVHFHRHDAGQDHGHSHAVRAGVKPFLIGMVHGLAGSAALALLVMSAIRSPWLAAAYILLFGLSSAVAMAGVTGSGPGSFSGPMTR